MKRIRLRGNYIWIILNPIFITGLQNSNFEAQNLSTFMIILSWQVSTCMWSSKWV